MDEKNIKKERRILNDLVLQSKDSIKNILEHFKNSIEQCHEKAYEEDK